ncbi:MAG: pilin [Patescibacteria group bacterium]
MFRAFKLAVLAVTLSSSFGIFAPAIGVRAADLGTQFTDINSSTTASQGIIFAGICPANVSGVPAPCECRDNGNCTLENVLQVFVNLSTFILGISGTAVLFVFVYGGFKWVFSRGDSEWITAGKNAITAGVIGLCIIFGAYVAINFIVSGLTTKSGTEPTLGNLEDTVNQSVTGGSPTTGVFTTE